MRHAKNTLMLSTDRNEVVHRRLVALFDVSTKELTTLRETNSIETTSELRIIG
jgi:hypothetical protein